MKRRQIRLQGDKWQAVLVWEEAEKEDLLIPMDPKVKLPERYVLFGPIGEGAELIRIEGHEIVWLVNAMGSISPECGGGTHSCLQTSGFVSR